MFTLLAPFRSRSFGLSTVACLVLAVQNGMTTMASAQETVSQNEPEQWAISLAWLDDETVVYTASGGSHFQPGLVVKMDVASGKTETVGEADCSLWALTRADDSTFVACDYRGNLYTVDSAVTKLPVTLSWSRAIESVGSQRIVVGTQDGKLSVVDLKELKVVAEQKPHDSQVMHLQYDDSSGELLSVDAIGNLVRSKVDTLEKVVARKLNAEGLWACATNGAGIVAGGAGREIIFSASDLKQSFTANTTSDWISTAVKIADADLVLLGTLNGHVVVFDAKTLHRVSETQVAESGIWDMKLSPEGNFIAIATRKQGVKVLEVEPLITDASAVKEAAKKLLPPMPE